MGDDNRPAFNAALRDLGAGAMTVADVGARWGASGAWFRLDPLARLVGFEPDPDECRRLNEKSDPARERFYPVALGWADGTGTLHVTKEPACSSLYPPSPFMLDRFPSLRPIMAPDRTLNVPLTRMATWAKDAGIDRVDFIKLDTQGAELDILRGAGDLLDGCLGIEAEVMFSPLYEGQPLFADVDGYLRSRGFTLWRLDSLAHYTDRPSERLGREATVHYEHVTVRHPTGDGRLVWANAIYFRDRGTRQDRRSRLVLAALLEAVGDIDGSRACLEDTSGAMPTALRGHGDAQEHAHAEPWAWHPNCSEYIDSLPLDPFAKKRIRMTVGCDDSRGLPKVPGAGETFEHDGVRVQLMHNGVKVVEGGYYGPWMTEVIRLLEGHHEPQEERAFHEILRHLRPGAHMIELGCFWGYYSLWFAKEVPGGRLVLVEPDPRNLAIGKQNFALNGMAGEFHQASVGRAHTPPRPFFCESDNQNHDVAQIGVDELIRDTGLPRVDLLLADIQGAELEMLEGAAGSIDRGLIRFVFLSTHHHLISRDPLIHQKCVEFVRNRGGHILVEHNVTESFSGDGLLVASFDPADRGLPAIHVSRNWPSNSLFRELEYDLAEALGQRSRDR